MPILKTGYVIAVQTNFTGLLLISYRYKINYYFFHIFSVAPAE